MSDSEKEDIRILAATLSDRPGVALEILSLEDRISYAVPFEGQQLVVEFHSARKKAEFTLGRAAADRAIRRLGLSQPPTLLKGKKSEPIWPEGFIGSITHCEPWTVAAVARRAEIASLGIDLESVRRMRGDDISRLVCCDSELAWVGQGIERWQRLTMLFSAKEAIFKAFYPACQQFFDFRDVRLAWIAETGRFQGILLVELGQKYVQGYGFAVDCCYSGDWVFSYMIESAS